MSGDLLDSRPLPPAPPPATAASRPLDSLVRTALPKDPPKTGQRVGDFELLEAVGAGGFSVVYRARRAGTTMLVAVKLPRVEAFVEHLRREAQMAARFSDPQVVGILEGHLDHDPPFLVMPYIEGANLALPDEAPGPRRIVEAFRTILRIAKVVARLHAQGIAHGDLKPGNIRHDPAGKCHLLDLGIARVQVAARQQSTLRASVVSVTGEKIAGTLEFMAPEVLSGEPPACASDVYALGVMLHHLLCGRPPAFGVAPAQLNPFLPPGTEDFLRQMLHHDPAQRAANAGALLPTLERFIDVEVACLRRRNGHARRRVLVERMRTLARGAKALFWTGAAAALAALTVHLWAERTQNPDLRTYFLMALFAPFYLFGWLGILLGMTTINAWILRVPEKLYKNRAGHRWWSFMMQ